ncbi:MAG TPA: transglutaminaseTgpA domain-containing protein [Jatrophihabitantaceae bacterium]|jgi:transglutaminase-like putative cysteine protease|nr:transglutaminaseTgpA domain-containing protein [Jatrophihabitantaceae bacterium]
MSGPAPGSGAGPTLRVLLGTALAVLPLKQILPDSGWLVDSWAAMAITVLPAALLRLRRPPSIWQLVPGLLGLVAYLTSTFLSAHAYFDLIPTTTTWADLSAQLTALHRISSDASAPLDSTPAIRLALAFGLGLLATAIDLIAVQLRRPALAGIPFLLIFTVSGAVPRHTVALFWAALAASGFLLVLSAHATAELPRWGRVVRRAPAAGRTRLLTAHTGRGIGICAVAVAILVPLFIPMPSGNLIADALHHSGGDGGANGVALDQLASLRGELLRGTPVPLFTVTVPPAQNGSAGSEEPAVDEPFYLREAVLSTYNGSAWVAAEQGPSQPLGPDTSFGSQPPVNPDAVRSYQFSASITIQQLAGNAPGFEFPASISGLSAPWSWDTGAEVLTGPGVKSGQRYTEDVIQPEPTTADLLQAGDAGTVPGQQEYLQLPSVPASVGKLVEELTHNASDSYQRALAISDYFTDPANGFTYSLATKSGDSGNDLVDFLQAKTGFCQQYAAAMGVMLRLAGVPARVVVGYTHGAPDADGTFQVTTDDAHAWVEAYFGGIGWIPFDPTPLGGVNAGRSVPLGWAPRLPAPPQSTPTAPVQNRPSTAPVAGSRPTSRATSPDTAVAPTSSWPADWIVPAGVAVVLLSALLTPALLRIVRRRRRLSGAEPPPETLWAELAETCADLGLGWSAARSPRQVASWLGEFGLDPGPNSALATLAAAVESDRYDVGTVPGRRVALASALLEVRRQLLAAAGRRQRLVAWLAPEAVRVTLRGGSRRVSSRRTGGGAGPPSWSGDRPDVPSARPG